MERRKFLSMAMAGASAALGAAQGGQQMGYPKLTPITATGSTKPRYLGDRFADWINVKDYGAVGDGGVDDSEALTEAFAAAGLHGKGVVFPQGTYLTSGFTVPVGCAVFAADAKFQIPYESEQKTFFTFSDGSSADIFTVASSTQGAWHTYVSIGANCCFGSIVLEATEGDEVEGEGIRTAGDHVKIGSVITHGFTHPFSVVNQGSSYTSGFELGSQYSTRYKRASYYNNITNAKIGNTFAVEASPNVTNTHIAFLVEGVSNSSFGDIRIEGSGATAVRIGGSPEVNPNSKSINLTFGTIYVEKCGGNAFKINANTIRDGVIETADNISVEGIYGVDVGDGIGSNNNNIVRITRGRNVYIGWIVGIAKDKSFCGNCGLRINDTNMLHVESMYIDKVRRNPIAFLDYQDEDDSYPQPDGVFDVHIDNCVYVRGTGTLMLIDMSNDVGRIYIDKFKVYADPNFIIQCNTPNNVTGPVEVSGSVEGNVAPAFHQCTSEFFRTDVSYQGKKSKGTALAEFDAVETWQVPQFDPGDVSNFGFLLYPRNGVTGEGQYGGSIEFTRVNDRRRAGAIATKQTGEGNYRRNGLAFFTSSHGTEDGTSNSLIEKLVLTHGGHLLPAVNETTSVGTQNIGDASHVWKNLYLNSSVISSSDARLKDNIEDISESIFRAWGKVRFKIFQFSASISEKGADAARLHTGVVAQEVQEAFVSEGLDASRFGLFCHDEWPAQYKTVGVLVSPEQKDEDGNIVADAVYREEQTDELLHPAGDVYSIRYEEALALECAYQRWRLKRLEERVNQLTNNTNN